MSVSPVRVLYTLIVLAVGVYNLTEYYSWMGEPGTADSRQPAVEVDEFELWQTMQISEAESDRWGFNVGQWHQMRGDLRPQ